MRKKCRPDGALTNYVQPIATKISPRWNWINISIL